MSPEQETENLYELINAHNEGIDKTFTDEDPAEDPATVEAEETASPEGEAEVEETEKKEKAETEGEEGEKAAETAAETGELSITPDADFETFTKEKAAYLETVEITPQLQAILDRQEAEITAARQNSAQTELSESASKTINAINQLFETEIVNNEVVPNAKPIVEVLRTEYANEFPTIVREAFQADSTKYQGLSMFEEVLVDTFGANEQQLANIELYLKNPAHTLPIAQSDLPPGIDEKFSEAYRDIPEVKRFEIQSLVEDIARLEKELAAEENEYYKKTISEQIGTVQAKLNAEISTLQKIQVGIDSQKAQQAAAARQRQEAYQRFETKTLETYNGEIFGMADNFVQELAPKLTFVEGEAQSAQARNILARIQNSLAFTYTVDQKGEVQFISDPTADYYAKQLLAEGVKFDFQKGRNLLQDHFKAVRKLEFLEASKASPAAIENAKRAKNNLLKDIKTEQLELLGQITSKYVQSSNKALEQKVKAVADKKQKARAVIVKGGGALPKQQGDIRKEIEEYNRRVKDGDDLYNSYAE